MGIDDVWDRISKTIIIVELRSSAIHWAEPKDIAIEDLLATGINGHDESGCGSHHSGGMNVLLSDGSVHFFSEDASTDLLRSWLTREGGEVVPLP